MRGRSGWEEELATHGRLDAESYRGDPRPEVDKLAARRQAENTWLVGQYWQRQFNTAVRSVFGLWMLPMLGWWRLALVWWLRRRARAHRGSREELWALLRRDSMVATVIMLCLVALVGLAIVGGVLALLVGPPP